MTTASTHVRIAKRIAPAPYEHEELELNFAVEPGQSLEQELFKHKALLYKTLKATVTFTPSTTTAPTEQSATQGDSSGKESNGKEKASQKSSQKESGEKSGKEEVKTSSEAKAPAEKSESKPSDKKEKPEKAEKASTKKADEGIPYDSENKDHKSTLSNFLTKLTGSKDWAADKVKSAGISKEKLHGQPFITKDGTVLPSFEALCKEHFAFAMKGGDDVL